MNPRYQETIDFLFSQLPVFQRDGAAAYKPGLDTIIGLCHAIGDPHQKFPTIHIAGTNGKGSSSHSIASVLQESGYKTGLYTSPHLVDFRERIRVNGQMIPEEDVIFYIDAWKSLIEQWKPSFFEITVALAFQYFASQKVDIAVIEVGMGGRLDSTNIIHPVISLITNISFDHQKFLGNTLPAIAGEKAGIIKPGVPVVISEKQPETEAVFMQKSMACIAPIYFASDQWTIETKENFMDGQKVEASPISGSEKLDLILSLPGDYQLKNLPGILSSCHLLKNLGWKISNQTIQSGLAKVQRNTGLMGRWQILKHSPLVICDVAHNEAGVTSIVRQFEKLNAGKKWIIWGMVNDKDHESIISLLPEDAFYFITEPGIPRKLPKEELAIFFSSRRLSWEFSDSVPMAIEKAISLADPKDVIFIGGSTFVVADIPFLNFPGLD